MTATPSNPGQSPGTPDRGRRLAHAIVKKLRDHGHVAFLAGGCVRDELLGLAPKDFDVATDATPDRVASLFPKTQEVGAAFGVVLVKDSGVAVEVAAFRQDGPYSDRRRPDHIVFSDAKADAQRRDFTINALFLDPFATRPEDRVIDHVGGVADLSQRIVRAVGDPAKRLEEDHLRALRAVRFAARLGFDIHPNTRQAIVASARALAGVSRERIGEELRRILGHPTRANGIQWLEALGLDGVILDEPSRASPRRLVERLDPSANPTLVLAAWCIDRGLDPADRATVAHAVRRVRRSVCLSNEEAEELAGSLEAARQARDDWGNLGIAARKRAASGSWFQGAMSILRAGWPTNADQVAQDVRALASTPGGLAPEPWVSGHDLIALGLSPGPAFKGILDRVYDSQLDGALADRQAALELARRLGVQSS